MPCLQMTFAPWQELTAAGESHTNTLQSQALMVVQAASSNVKAKPLPAVTFKAKAPEVAVKAKQKADVAGQSDVLPRHEANSGCGHKRACW